MLLLLLLLLLLSLLLLLNYEENIIKQKRKEKKTGKKEKKKGKAEEVDARNTQFQEYLIFLRGKKICDRVTDTCSSAPVLLKLFSSFPVVSQPPSTQQGSTGCYPSTLGTLHSVLAPQIIVETVFSHSIHQPIATFLHLPLVARNFTFKVETFDSRFTKIKAPVFLFCCV